MTPQYFTVLRHKEVSKRKMGNKTDKTTQPVKTVEQEDTRTELEKGLDSGVNFFGQLSIGEYTTVTGKATGFCLSEADQAVIQQIAERTKKLGYTVNVIPISLLSPDAISAMRAKVLRPVLLKEIQKYCTLRQNGNRISFTNMPPKAKIEKRGKVYTVLKDGGYRFQPEKWLTEGDNTVATASDILHL